MAYQIEDEFGAIWHVGKGDPAYEHVQKLRKANYTWIILPRCLILDGNLLGTEMPTSMYKTEYSTERDLRLMECMEVLGGD